MKNLNLNPSLECDLVMKGGITSGVVYPPAIFELARNYRFRSIGGTSAGAIAAAVTAAAEYGRESGGMGRLLELSEHLAEEDVIKDLLHPSPATRPLMMTLLELGKTLTQSQDKLALRVALSLTSSALVHTPAAFALGAGLGAAVSALYTHLTGGRLSGPGLLTPLLFGSIGGMGGSAYALGRVLLSHIPKQNFYGLCKGHGEAPHGRLPLTDWLHNSLQHLANLDTDAAPLTFRQLAEKPFADPQSVSKPASVQHPNIALRMVTSNLSQSQPYVLPFEQHSFLFQVRELEQLFPQTVVAFMQQNAAQQLDVLLPEGYCWLPSGSDLPVVVAARLSLSFPLLISAVPLYTIRLSAFNRRVQGQPLQLTTADLQQNWFSDGGICSNFPIHFFDAWLPTRPTFGINLVNQTGPELDQLNNATGSIEARSVIDIDNTLGESESLHSAYSPDRFANYFLTSEGKPGEHGSCDTSCRAKRAPELSTTPSDHTTRDVIYLPRADVPRAPEWQQLNGLGDFGMAIITIAQNYRDTMQSLLPSYYERIVQIKLQAHEGGINLAMPPETIKGIQAKGRYAGKELVHRFNMQHHQWTRLVVLMSLLEKQLSMMESALSTGKFNYTALFEQHHRSKTDSELHQQFPLPKTEEWCEEAHYRIKKMHILLNDIKKRQNSLQDSFEAILRVTPEL